MTYQLPPSSLLMMKILAVLLLVAVSWGGSEGLSPQEWSTNKGLETCYGNPVMDMYYAKVKSRKEKCFGIPAPELELPMFRAPRKLVQNLLDGANDKEEGKQRMMRKWMEKTGMMKQMTENDDKAELTISFPHWVLLKLFQSLMAEGKSPNNLSTKVLEELDASRRGEDGQKRLPGFVKQMLDNRYDSNGSMQKGRPDIDNDDYINYLIKSVADLRRQRSSSRPSNQGRDFEDDIKDFIQSATDILVSSSRRRNKRATADIEERLVEKLQAEQEKMKMKMANSFCFLREMKVIDADGNIDLDAYFKEEDTYPKEDMLLKANTKKMARACYKELPTVWNDDLTFVEKLARAKKFDCCVEKGWTKVCMKRDVRKKLEKNFGSISKLLEDTGMDQETLLSLAQGIVM